MDPLHCVECDKGVPSDAPGGLCPRCLILAATTEPSEPCSEGDSEFGFSASSQPTPPALAPGDRLGPYLIHRLLGRGGMGEVYEAEHLDHHRRLAIKVLKPGLGRDEGRARLQLEGELAASVAHPNLVYVFGCEDIDGAPVLAMELLPGRTLKDQVAEGGPMAPARAVDAILEVIAGLEAASQVGVLHRDVKPSNCFVDHDGTIKVGDFGLSILLSEQSQSVDGDGWFQGTPAFAPPEQERGQVLSVRADVYAVGATLFYLLTGRPPVCRATDTWTGFGAPVVSSARTAQPAVTPELDRVLAQCLAREPGERFASLEDLATALTPFSSGATTPAPWGRRFAAGLLDGVYVTPAQGLLLAALVVSCPAVAPMVALGWALFLPPLVYHALAESLWGATVGLRECQLKVVRPGGGRPGFFRALVRAAIVLVPAAVTFGFVASGNGNSAPVLSTPLGAVLAFVGLTALVFSSATSRNGCAGIHDWLTKTRLILRAEAVRGPSRASRPALPEQLRLGTCIGPYTVVGILGPTDQGHLLSGFDPSLKRPVWIHAVPPGTPERTSAADNQRSLRLRWLGGQRSALGGWDAFEALDGSALLALDQPLSWPVVCGVLRDLAMDLQASPAVEVADPPRLEQVWITVNGAVRLLDFSVPARSTNRPSAVDPVCGDRAQGFLYAVAAHALKLPIARPLSLSASSVLDRLQAGSYGTLAELVATLTRLAQQPAGVTVARRSSVLGFSIVLTALATHAVRDYAIAHSVALSGIGSSTCALVALLGALAVRGGLGLRSFGIAVVTADGREVSRLRAMSRALLAWSWVPVQVLATLHGWMPINVLAGVGKLAGVIWSTADPARGPHDWLARTYLVPR